MISESLEEAIKNGKVTICHSCLRLLIESMEKKEGRLVIEKPDFYSQCQICKANIDCMECKIKKTK
jgi:hypothetical protein